MRSTKEVISGITSLFHAMLENKHLKDDVTSFLHWLLNEIADSDLQDRLQNKPLSKKTKKFLTKWLMQRLAEEQFAEEWNSRIDQLLFADDAVKENRVQNTQLDIGGNFFLGDRQKTKKFSPTPKKNIVKDSEIRVEGDFRVGDELAHPDQTKIKNQVNIAQNYGQIEQKKAKGSPLRSQWFRHGYALLIGVGADLKGSIHDANALYKTLTDPEIAAYPKEQVRLLTAKDATKNNILEALDRLREQGAEDPEATVLIYYSGHGTRRRRKKGAKYDYFLLPYDYTQSTSEKLLLPGTKVTRKIEKIPAKKLFVLLDCCHAQGVLAKNTMTRDVPLKHASFVHLFKPGAGKVIMASSRNNEVSWEVDGKGLFTGALVEALHGCNSTGEEGFVHMLDILQYLMVSVPVRSKKLGKTQHPVINRIENLDAQFHVCRFNAKIAEKTKSVLPSSKKEQRLLQTLPQKTIQQYQFVKNQINIETNQGKITMK